jgi:hypothetical protein
VTGVDAVPSSAAVLVPSSQPGTSAVLVDPDGHVIGCSSRSGAIAQTGDALTEVTAAGSNSHPQTRLVRAAITTPKAASTLTLSGRLQVVKGSRQLTALAPKIDSAVRSLTLAGSAEHRLDFSGPLLSAGPADARWAGVRVVGVAGSWAALIDLDGNRGLLSGLALVDAAGTIRSRIPAATLPCPPSSLSLNNFWVADPGVWVACASGGRLETRLYAWSGGAAAAGPSIPLPADATGRVSVKGQNDGVWVYESDTSGPPLTAGYVAHLTRQGPAWSWALLTAPPGWFVGTFSAGPPTCSCAVVGIGQAQGLGSSGLAYGALYTTAKG